MSVMRKAANPGNFPSHRKWEPGTKPPPIPGGYLPVNIKSKAGQQHPAPTNRKV